MKAIIEKIVKIRPTPYGFIGKDDTGIINKTVVIKLFTSSPLRQLLTGWRIARCNPLGRWGYDPVPEKGRWKNPARHLSASALFSTRHEK